MNNIERIKEKINAANDAAIEELLAKARRDGESVLAQADARVAELNAQTDAKIQTSTEQIRRISVSSAELAAKKELLGAKQRLIAEVFEEAVRRLCAQDPEQYAATVVRLALECPSGGVVFRLAKKAEKKVPADLPDRINTALIAAGKQPFAYGEPVDTIESGFIVEGKNWRQVCSFESLVAQYREELEPQVAAVLFGNES